MSENDKLIEQIIISIDAGGLSQQMMELAVFMASHLRANLCGLFIEDTELLELANLPFTREITMHNALTRELSSAAMERNLSAVATRMQQTLEQMTRLSDVMCSFRTVRGPRLQSLLKESADSQLLLLMPRKRFSASNEHISRVGRQPPNILYYDGSASAHKAVRIIQSMNTATGLRDLVLIAANESAAQEFKQIFAQDSSQVTCLVMDAPNMSRLLTLARQRAANMLILPLDKLLQDGMIETRRLLDRLPCMLLLVR